MGLVKGNLLFGCRSGATTATAFAFTAFAAGATAFSAFRSFATTAATFGTLAAPATPFGAFAAASASFGTLFIAELAVFVFVEFFQNFLHALFARLRSGCPFFFGAALCAFTAWATLTAFSTRALGIGFVFGMHVRNGGQRQY